MAEQIGLRAVFDISQFNKGLGAYNKGIGRANKKTAGFTTKAGKAFTGLGKSALKFGAIAGGVALGGVVALGAGLVAFGVSATKEGAAFTKAMSNVGAISGAVGKEFGDLEQKARDLGRTTKFTATEAAEGMGFLAMAGFEVNEIISAMPGVLNLASAANMDLGRASDIVSNILSGFGEDASQTSRFVDVLAKTAASSNTSVEQLGQGMKFVAPVAEAFGFSVEQTSAAMGILGDAGLQAGIAGRGLRGVLSKLGAPTKAAREAMGELGVEVFNLDGTMKSLPEIIGEFTEATKDMTDEQKSAALGAIFSRGEIAPLLVLMKKGEKGIADFGNELENSAGFAAEVAAKQLDNLSGDVTLFQSALSGVKIDVFKALEPILRKIVQLGTDLLAKFGPSLAAAFDIVGETISNIIETGRELFDVFQQGGAESILNKLGITPEANELISKIISTFADLSESISGLFAIASSGTTDFSWLDTINTIIVFVNENFETFKGVILGVGGALAGAAIASIIASIGVAIVAIASPIGVLIALAALLGAAWANDWGGIRTTVLDIWENVLKPAFFSIVDWLEVNIPVALQILADAWENVLLPALNAVWDFIQNTLLPIWADIGVVLADFTDNILPVLRQTWQTLVDSWTNDVKPALDSLFVAFGELVIALGISNKTTSEGSVQGGILKGILVGLTTTIETLTPIITLLGAALTAVVEFITNRVQEVTNLITAFQSMSDTTQSLTDRLINLSSALIDFVLPDFLTPGSPTPFEQGLVGVAGALGNATSLISEFGQVAGGRVASVFNSVLPEAIQNFVSGVQVGFAGMIVTAQEYAKFLTNVIAKQTMPIAVKAHENFSASSLVVWTSITDLANIYNDLLMQIALESMPSLSAAFDTVRTTIETASKAIAAAIGSIKTKLDTDVPGIIAKFGEVETAIGKVSAALGDLNIGKVDELGTAFSGVKGKVEDVISKVQELIDKINAIPPIPSGPSSTSTSAAKGLDFQAGTPGNTNGLLGLGFQIPQGFSNDSFGPIFAQSGEEMLVAPRETSIESLIFSRLANLLGNTSTVQGPTITNIYNFDMTVNTSASAQAVIGQFEVAKGLIGP